MSRLVTLGPALLAIWAVGTAVVSAVDSSSTEAKLREGTILPAPNTPAAVAGYRSLAGALLPLEGRAIVLAFAPSCPICNDNMANWVDLLASLPPDVSVLAVTADSTARTADYWRPFRPGVVRVEQVSKRFFVDSLGVRSTPSTILVEDGVPTRVLRGLLIPESRAVVERWLGEDVFADAP